MKPFILFLWGIWDGLYFTFNRMKYVSKNENLFRIVRKVYRGPSLQTISGHWIHAGDEIIKIHLYNYRLAKEMYRYPKDKSPAIYLKRNIQSSLAGLGSYVEQLPNRERIKGIVGTSLLNRGAERLGFTTYDVETTPYFMIKQYLYKFIYLLVHPSGLAYIKTHGKRLKSKHLVMSAHELLNLYVYQENKNEKDADFHRKKSWRRSLSSSQSD